MKRIFTPEELREFHNKKYDEWKFTKDRNGNWVGISKNKCGNIISKIDSKGIEYPDLEIRELQSTGTMGPNVWFQSLKNASKPHTKNNNKKVKEKSSLMKNPKKLILFLFLGLLGFFLIKKELYNQDIVRTLHSLDTKNYVEVVMQSKGNRKRDLLKIHSKETFKVTEYSLLDNINDEQVYEHFENKGWTNYAVADAIIWNIHKAGYILLSDENMPEEEIFETFKEESPSWTNQYSQVLLEEISIDREQ